MKRQLLLLLAIISTCSLFAQNTVTVSNQGMTSEEMIQTIFDGGEIDISNVTYLGGENQLRFFSNNQSNLPLDSGLIMATGGASLVSGPNNSGGASEPSNEGDNVSFDPDLDQLLDEPDLYNDIAIVEFDFTTGNDSIIFKYSFASEEYNEFVCSTFNDGAAILLSGPGISGTFSNDAINIATVPNSDAPVGINSINSGTEPDPNGYCEQANPNWQNDSIYFYDNTINNTGNIWADSNATQFDGFTVLLEAKAEVIPGETYHVKFVIGDGSDAVYDSGFLIEAKAPVEYECTQLQANTGDPCDDGNPATQTDQINSNCECEGTTPGEAEFFDSGAPYTINPYEELTPDGGIIALNDETENVAVNVYWSQNGTLDSSDELIDNFEGAFNTDTIPFPTAEYPLPLTQSQYYLIYEMTNMNGTELNSPLTTSLEVNFTDNEIVGVITNIDSVFVQPADTTVTMDFTVYNDGPADLSASEIEFYWSDTYSQEEVAGELVGTWSGPAVMAGDSLNAQFTFEIPLPIEQFQYFLTLVPVDATKSSDDEIGPIVPIYFSSLTGFPSARDSGWRIFSNSSGQLSLTAGEVESSAQSIRLVDLTGRQIWSKSVTLRQDQSRILQLPEVSRGIYLIQILDGNNRLQKKLLLQ